MDASLEPGDAPEVRDLLLAHYRDPTLEVEGKLGRRSRDRFTAGVSADQFAALEARFLDDCAPCVGLLPRSGAPPAVEVTIDRFHLLGPVEDDGRQRSRSPGRARGAERMPTVRSSYACDGLCRPSGEPVEVLLKRRLSDCHIGREVRNDALPEHCLVDSRVSFSQEIAFPEVERAHARLGPLVHERLKRRRTFEAFLWRVMLTQVTIDRRREAFEVEVELKMDVVRTRLEAAAQPADEALAITRELVAALREMARWAAEIPMCKKRKRVEDIEAVERELKTAMEEPEVDAELRRHISLEGREALHLAKQYLCDVIRLRLASVSESALHRSAGRQVAKYLRRAKVLDIVGSNGEGTCGKPAIEPSLQIAPGVPA